MLVNGTSVYDYGPSSTNITRDFMEVAQVLKDGANNIEFKITGGQGVVDISDVIVWYRLTV